MVKQIISDAGPLIAFGRMDRLSILFQLFDSIIISKIVADECISDLSRPGAINIKKAMDKGKINTNSKGLIGDFDEFVDILGVGEASAIKLALMDNLPLLIDEKLGRRAAIKLGIKIIGTAGVLILAKQHNIIDKVSPVIDTLKKNEYRMSQDLIQETLKLAKE